MKPFSDGAACKRCKDGVERFLSLVPRSTPKSTFRDIRDNVWIHCQVRVQELFYSASAWNNLDFITDTMAGTRANCID